MEENEQAERVWVECPSLRIIDVMSFGPFLDLHKQEGIDETEDQRWSMQQLLPHPTNVPIEPYHENVHLSDWSKTRILIWFDHTGYQLKYHMRCSGGWSQILKWELLHERQTATCGIHLQLRAVSTQLRRYSYKIELSHKEKQHKATPLLHMKE